MFTGESKGHWSKLRNTYLSIICLKAANIRTTDKILADKLKGLNINDDESMISDPFGEYHDVGYLSNGFKMKLNTNKYDRDINVVSRFTEEYKKVLKLIREEQEIPREMCDETLDVITKICQSTTATLAAAQTTQEKSYKSNCQLDNEIIYEIIRPNSENPPEEQSVLTYDYMSGIWNMIKEECKGKLIFITPLNYDFYEGMHVSKWLKNDYVTDVKIQESQKKCLEWLHKQDNSDETED